MGIGEAEAFSERLKRELQALEAANVHAILENEPLINEVTYEFLFDCGCNPRGVFSFLLCFVFFLIMIILSVIIMISYVPEIYLSVSFFWALGAARCRVVPFLSVFLNASLL